MTERKLKTTARQRAEDICQLIANGQSAADIAAQYGVSRERVRQIVRRHQSRLAIEESRPEMLKKGLIEGLGLSSRAQNALKNANVESIDDALQFIDAMRYERRYARNFGAVAFTELVERLDALGLMPREETGPVPLPPSYILLEREWSAAKVYWQGRCAVCGAVDAPLQQDHWIPRSYDKISTTSVTNIVPLCLYCNSAKSDQDPYLWLVAELGQEAAEQKMREIFDYFDWWRNQV